MPKRSRDAYEKGKSKKPYKKTKYSKGGSKTYKYNNEFSPQSLIKVGFPKTNTIKLRYVDSVSINPGVLTLNYHQFRANSCFDPDFTATGHQPMMFDMWSSLYNHYVVLGAKIEVKFLFNSTTPVSGGVIYGINLSDDTTITNDPTTMMEQGLSKYMVMGSQQSLATVGSAPSLSHTFSAKKFFNVKDVRDNVTRLGAMVTANPSEVAIFNVFCGSLTSTDITSIQCLVTIDFIVQFNEPKEQIQS